MQPEVDNQPKVIILVMDGRGDLVFLQLLSMGRMIGRSVAEYSSREQSATFFVNVKTDVEDFGG